MQSQFNSEKNILYIEKIVNGGYGIAFLNKEAYFVPYVFPGETVIPTVKEKKRGVYFVREYEIVNHSSNRIVPKCEFFGKCGGCHFQMADYNTQLSWKKNILDDASQRFLKLNILEKVMEFGIIDSPELNYRFRTRFQVSSKKAGFFKLNSNEIIEISGCSVVKEKINKIFQAISKSLKTRETTDFISGLKAFEVRTNLSQSSASILFISSSGNGVKEFSSRILPELEESFESVSLSLSLSKNRLPGKGYRTIYGPEKIYSIYEKYSFGFSPLSFFQPNFETAFKVYEVIKDMIKKENGVRVLDIYCGAGVLGVLLSDEFEVLGIEANSHAYRDAIENAFVNESNAQFINMDAKELFELKEVDTVIVNPPRSGMSRNLVFLLSNAKEVRNLIYLSCDPATFFRDARYFLSSGFSIKSLYLIDFYPQTCHIEVLSIFKRT